ncbi:trypsin-like peptidase domain-containing protein [Methylophilus glucosoxydans]|uniref:Trypsin-like peptidase domain-containing protein n=1 Tax=Methylophilus glucosoxydans TaxID=752553 RepID=A0ABW3GIQ1_9PROT
MALIQTDPYSQALLLIKMRFGETELAVGTAFFYKRGGALYLVSNWHNYSGRDPITKQPMASHGGIPDNLLCYACLNQNTISREWLPIALNDSMGPAWLVHPVHGSEVDIGVLPVQLPDRFRAIVLNELPSTSMRLGISQDVFVLGYPLGLLDTHGMPIWKRASVATEPGTSQPNFLIDTATRSGMSGSPVILRFRGFYKQDLGSAIPSDEDWFGEGDMFVGVYSGRLGKSELEAQLGVVWKARLIDEIIDAKVRTQA